MPPHDTRPGRSCFVDYDNPGTTACGIPGGHVLYGEFAGQSLRKEWLAARLAARQGHKICRTCLWIFQKGGRWLVVVCMGKKSSTAIAADGHPVWTVQSAAWSRHRQKSHALRHKRAWEARGRASPDRHVIVHLRHWNSAYR